MRSELSNLRIEAVVPTNLLRGKKVSRRHRLSKRTTPPITIKWHVPLKNTGWKTSFPFKVVPFLGDMWISRGPNKLKDTCRYLPICNSPLFSRSVGHVSWNFSHKAPLNIATQHVPQAPTKSRRSLIPSMDQISCLWLGEKKQRKLLDVFFFWRRVGRFSIIFSSWLLLELKSWRWFRVRYHVPCLLWVVFQQNQTWSIFQRSLLQRSFDLVG